MRYLLIVLLLMPAMAYAQDDWGPAVWIDSVQSWQEVCSDHSLEVSLSDPTIAANDSMIFFIVECDLGRFVANSEYRDGNWQLMEILPDASTGNNVNSLFYQLSDSTLYFGSPDIGGIGKTCYRDGVWTPMEGLGDIINQGGNEVAPSLPTDGSRLYFMRGTTILLSDITNGEFSIPIALPNTINNPDSIQRYPGISPDGRRLYFNRWGPQNPLGPYNMYFSEQIDGTWQPAVTLDTDINFGLPNSHCFNRIGMSFNPSFSLTGQKMYFEYGAICGEFCEPCGGIFASELVTSVDDPPGNTPSQFALSAYPNPFNAKVSINISGDIESISELSIYNIAGQRVRNLAIAPSVIWDGKDADRNDVSSGIYFVRAANGNQSRVIKVALVR